MFLQQLPGITAIVLDIDGVLTDATVLVSESGEQLRTFNVRDGYAIKLAIRKGIRIAAISGGRAKSVVARLESLGVAEVFLGVEHKLPVYLDFISRHGLDPQQVMYMGDDIPDIVPMKRCGVPVCPNDAVAEVKALSAYISPFGGGKGCVRDVLEKVLKLQGKWYDPNDEHPDDQITSS